MEALRAVAAENHFRLACTYGTAPEDAAAKQDPAGMRLRHIPTGMLVDLLLLPSVPQVSGRWLAMPDSPLSLAAVHVLHTIC
jgi:hypothetical protein